MESSKDWMITGVLASGNPFFLRTSASSTSGAIPIPKEMPFDRACIILFEEDGPRPAKAPRLKVAAQRVPREAQPEASGAQVIVSTSILHRVAQAREAVLVTEGDLPARPADSFVRSGAASALCVPLLVGGRVTGVIYLDRTSSGSDLSREHVEALGPALEVRHTDRARIHAALTRDDFLVSQ